MRTFSAAPDVLDHALTLVERPGVALEFGVATGDSLRRIVAGMPEGSTVYGFDSFEGLPEFWRPGFDAGMFRCTPPDVPGADLVVGRFEDTLPPLRGWFGPLSLLHIDCDLYSSTAVVLAQLVHSIGHGCLVVFDEFHGYPGCERHEQRAWDEFADAHGVSYEVLASGPEQLLIRIH